MELWFLFSACPLMMVYTCTKFRKNILKDFRVIYLAEMISIVKFSKEHNSVKNVGGV